MTTERVPGDVVIVSPHLDDGVLSLAATAARVVRSGTRVRMLTVFAGDPGLSGPAAKWDRRGGFTTQAEAAARRREEDRQACSLLGVEPVWLDFLDGGYEPERVAEAVAEAVDDAVRGADAVLLPGFPLTNPDHAWLASVLLDRKLSCDRLGIYAEQPYRWMVRKDRRLGTPDVFPPTVPDRLAWERTPPRPFALREKRRAILAYRSQLPLLGMPSPRSRKLNKILLHEALHGGEAYAWLPT